MGASEHPSLRWGIAGTGMIAGVFADTFAAVTGGSVVAVGSRAAASAARFAAAHAVERAHGSYAALLDDQDVDAIYVATPHAHHEPLTVAALEAGKHVLCEKPMSIGAGPTARMIATARTCDRFLMEALWSRFLPAYRTLDKLVADGAIGDVLCVDASLGFRAPFDPDHRLFAPDLGGGALLDLGIYPVHLAHSVLGPPTTVDATARVGTTGVDEHVVVTMGFAGGALAIAHAAIRAQLPGTAVVTGTDGAIEIPAPMQCPSHLDVIRFGDGDRRRIDASPGPAPFHYEVDEVHRCVADGRTESPRMPWTASLELAETLDRARSALGKGAPEPT